jgi:hypothetical protein
MVAMTIVGMMQMSVNHVVNVIPMRRRLMTAARSMHVIRRMPRALVAPRAIRWIRHGHLDRALVIVALVRAVQVAVVQVANVFAVRHRHVAAARAVNMVMIFVYVMLH